jgi:Flp pilus assembly pilin Flp
MFEGRNEAKAKARKISLFRSKTGLNSCDCSQVFIHLFPNILNAHGTRSDDMRMRKTMLSFLRADQGTTAIEYGMIAALIVVTIIAGLQTLGSGIVNTLYDKLLGAFS